MSILLLGLAPMLVGNDEVEVHAYTHFCTHPRLEQDVAWRLEDRGWTDGERWLPRERIDALRGLVLEAPPEVPDLLTTLGFTPAALAAHRDQVLRAAVPEAWAGDDPMVLRPESLPSISYEAVTERVRTYATGHRPGTSKIEVAVTLPGDPPVRVASRNRQPWMLPWTITVGERTWTTFDVGVPRALLDLVPQGSWTPLLDGTAYWRDRIWDDAVLWRPVYGPALDGPLCLRHCEGLPGWEEVLERFRLDDASTGFVELCSASVPTTDLAMKLALSTREPEVLDGARWDVEIAAGEPAFGLDVLMQTFAKARRCVEREPWLERWKRAAPGRRLLLHAQGELGLVLTWDIDVVRAWEKAGLAGAPEFQIELVEGELERGTVFLSSGDERGVVSHAVEQAPARHWLDEIGINLESDRLYLVVEPGGTHEAGTLR